MNCAPGWFSGVRFLCGAGGPNTTITVLEPEPATARVTNDNDINGNLIGRDSIQGDLNELLDKVARVNNFEKPKFELTSATKAGDNYASSVLRGVIHETNGRRDPLSVIIKTAPASKGRRQAFHSGLLFLKEGRMYQVVLPAFNSFLREYGLSTSETFPHVARCLATKIADDPDENAEDMIILEDLAALGFGMLDRKAGLDSDACRLVLRWLALFHGTSMAFRHLRPNDAAKVEESIREEALFSPDKPLILEMVPVARRSLSFVVDRYPPNSAEYKKLEQYVDHYSEEMQRLVARTDQLSCVTHGDCWTNNVLFRMNKDKQAEEAFLIDFQLSRVSSPVLDLSYLLFCCTTKETRDAYFQELLRDYHSELTSTLNNLGCDSEKVAPWSIFEDQCKSHMKFGLGMALITIPIFLADSSEVPDLDNVLEEGSVSKIVNEESNAQKELKKRLGDILQDFIELGYL